VIKPSGSKQARARLIQDNEIPLLPDEWDVQRFRFLFGESKERNGDEPVGDMLSVSEYRGVVPREYEYEEQRRTDDELRTYRVVRPGQLAVNTMWLNHLGLGVSEHLGHVSPAYAVYNISDAMDRRFAHHLFRSQYYLKIYLRYLYGIRPNSFQIKTDDWNSIPVIIPPRATQKAIADILDRETARIDQLIEKKTRFIALLNEKRIAVVTHAVTKGLDPSATTKDSGIDWIGGIPASWRLTKLGYIGTCANGINIGGDAFGTGFPFISYGDVYKNRELPAEVEGLVQSTRADRDIYSVKAGDVLFTRTSETVEEVGFPSVCFKTIEDAVFAGFLIRFRPFKGILVGGFSKFVFQNSGLRDFFAKEMKLVTRASLSQGLLQSMPVPVPPLEEQVKIANYLEGMDRRFMALVAKTERSIGVLKEARAALITAAVTGQIDAAKWGKQGGTDQRLDRIIEAMRA
jgi:type I restriction enzyme, S subunit